MPTVQELRNEARAQNIKGYSKMKKEELCAALKKGPDCMGKKKPAKIYTYLVSELKELAKARGIKGYSKMKKDQLCAALNIPNCERPAGYAPPPKATPKPKAKPKAKSKAKPKTPSSPSPKPKTNLKPFQMTASEIIHELSKHGIGNIKDLKRWIIKNHPDKFLDSTNKKRADDIFKIVMSLRDALKQKAEQKNPIAELFFK